MCAKQGGREAEQQERLTLAPRGCSEARDGLTAARAGVTRRRHEAWEHRQPVHSRRVAVVALRNRVALRDDWRGDGHLEEVPEAIDDASTREHDYGDRKTGT